MKLQTCAAVLLLCAGAARAADPAPAPKAPPPEPAVERLVGEDDNVRIEELRVRGETRSIVVRNKVRGGGGSEYQIVPRSGAHDPSQLGDSAGQRVWHFLSF